MIESSAWSYIIIMHLCSFIIIIIWIFFFHFKIVISLVFRMVEAEEEYVSQLEVLVTCFLRPLRMAASSKKPPCSHEDISSIFLNSETVLFLHQIFYKGLTTRMENWPTLILSEFYVNLEIFSTFIHKVYYIDAGDEYWWLTSVTTLFDVAYCFFHHGANVTYTVYLCIYIWIIHYCNY